MNVLGQCSHSTVSMSHVLGQLNNSVVPKNHAFGQVSHTCSHLNSIKLIFRLSSFYAQITKVVPTTRRTKENFANTSCFQHQYSQISLLIHSSESCNTGADITQTLIMILHRLRFIHSLHHDSLRHPESLSFSHKEQTRFTPV
jgi:hypothetical protein